MSKLEMKKARQLLRREVSSKIDEAIQTEVQKMINNGKRYVERTRLIIRFLILIIVIQAVVILFSGCVLDGETVGEVNYGTVVSTQIISKDDDGYGYKGEIKIIEDSPEVPAYYMRAELHINNKPVVYFPKGGHIDMSVQCELEMPCEIFFIGDDYSIIKVVPDKLYFYF